MLQVYAEGIHLVYMGASVINSTVVQNSDMLGVVPEDWQDTMNGILDNAYTYGREGISKMVMCGTPSSGTCTEHRSSHELSLT